MIGPGLDALLASGYYRAETVAALAVLSGTLAPRAYAAHNALNFPLRQHHGAS